VSGALDPAGPQAAHIADLWWLAFWVCVSVFVVVMATLGWALFNAFSRRSRWLYWSAAAAAAVTVVVAMVAALSLDAYGNTADPRAVITWQAGSLRSIPTEADTAQKTTALAAGSVGVIDKTFPLGWDRLVFPNGQTGWVRHDTVVPIWTDRSSARP
jgi:hypothetical protein